jgi:cysteine-rich repeat protein
MLFASCNTGSATSELERAGSSGGDGGVDGGQEECAFTQGYWKNHPEAWPVSSLELGSVSYTSAQLLEILRTPVGGNGLISLAHQLIAAKLNVANNADDTDIEDEIAAADALIGGLVIPPIGAGNLHPSETSSLVGELDEFNNTGECKDGPECGNGEVEEGEECDDGNTDDTDGCRNDCTCQPAPVCGNGEVEEGEECDDGNTDDTDGCSNSCKICIP